LFGSSQIVRLVNKPTAAALACGLDRLSQELRIVVIDFGGGTLDVTIMEFGKGVFEVKATSGNTQLGGTDMDKLVFELADHFRPAEGRRCAGRSNGGGETQGRPVKLPRSNCPLARQAISLFLFSLPGHRDRIHFDYVLTRAELERIVRPFASIGEAPESTHATLLHFSACEPLPAIRAMFRSSSKT